MKLLCAAMKAIVHVAAQILPENKNLIVSVYVINSLNAVL
jgi:hypothetical protein